MASEEDMGELGPIQAMVVQVPFMGCQDLEGRGELAHTAMVVQVPFMGCQDLEGRGDITHLLQLMVGNNLLMVPNNLLMVLSPLHMVLNLLLLVHPTAQAQ